MKKKIEIESDLKEPRNGMPKRIVFKSTSTLEQRGVDIHPLVMALGLIGWCGILGYGIAQLLKSCSCL